MSKSAIYTVNSSTQTVNINGVINPGSVIRRFGCNINLSGNAIRIDGAGYYHIDCNFTVAPTAAGTVTITALKDGIAIPGAIATAATSTAGNPVNLAMTCLVRENCACCDEASNITFVLTGAAALISNSAIVVNKF